MKPLPSLIIIGLAIIGSLSLHGYLHDQAWTQARSLLHQVLHGINKEISNKKIEPSDWSLLIKASQDVNYLRLTIIDSSGIVVADNHGDPSQMDNHSLRPEIKEASKSNLHTGSSIRTSRSTGVEYLYLAEAYYFEQNLAGYIRLALPTKHIESNVFPHFIGLVVPMYIMLLIIGVLWHALINKPNTDTLRTDAPPLPYKQTRHDSSEFDNVIWQKDRAFNLPAMLNSLSEGIIAVNSNEEVVYINKAATKILQTSESDALGQSVWNISRINIIPETIHECIKQRSDQFHEFQVLQQVKESHYGLSVTPIIQNQEDEENIYAAVAILDDISDEQRLNGIRRNFFTNVSHELKTPLAVIRGVIETMIDDKDMPNEQQHKFLEKAFSQCERLNVLVGDILTVSRLEDLESLQESESVSLSGLLRECANNLTNRAEQKGISIEASIPDEQCPINGDRELIQQAIDNLLSNAINYSPTKSKIKANLEAKFDCYIISIVDNGPGIPPHALERIFERFYRVDKARSRQVGGTGLGLSIAKHAVALHGGAISVQSEVSKGSTFIIQLPRPQNSGANHVN